MVSHVMIDLHGKKEKKEITKSLKNQKTCLTILKTSQMALLKR